MGKGWIAAGSFRMPGEEEGVVSQSHFVDEQMHCVMRCNWQRCCILKRCCKRAQIIFEPRVCDSLGGGWTHIMPAMCIAQGRWGPFPKVARKSRSGDPDRRGRGQEQKTVWAGFVLARMGRKFLNGPRWAGPHGPGRAGPPCPPPLQVTRHQRRRSHCQA